MLLPRSFRAERPGRFLGWLFVMLSLATGCAHSDKAMEAQAPASAPRDASYVTTASASSEDAGEFDAGVDDAAPEEAPEPAAPAPSAPPSRLENKLGMPGAATPSKALPSPSPSPEQQIASGDAAARDGKAPLLIYTAVLTMGVFGVEQALDSVESLAREAGGYLLERNDTSITVRIPATRFRTALDGVGKLGDELHRQVNARDVTDEYADLEIRLRNAEVMRQRLESLLAKTGNIGDALAVERELERVAQTIEQIKGRLKLLGEQVAFSTITVNFQPRATDQVDSKVDLPFEWLRELGLPQLLQL
jgi:hypothetical protein